jgi:protein-tyrosine phosphatase
MARDDERGGTGPIPDSYRVSFAALGESAPQRGRLFAGEYPGAKDETAAIAKMEQFRALGVTRFIDLTEAGEYDLRPYAPWLPAGTQHVRLPIRDLDVPTPEHMRAILDSIDAALAAGETVYVHCFGGIGRTGSVVGCWLVRHGLTGEAALATIAQWRENTPDGWKRSPETNAQRSFVREWEANETAR